MNNPILRGRNRSPWLLTTYDTWDDPPSIPPRVSAGTSSTQELVPLKIDEWIPKMMVCKRYFRFKHGHFGYLYVIHGDFLWEYPLWEMRKHKTTMLEDI